MQSEKQQDYGKMKLFMELPYDPKGYGDFGVSYIGTEAKIHFEYGKDSNRDIAEIKFEFCIYISTNGKLDDQINLPYDRIFISEENIGFDKKFSRFHVMLSGSDFQFNVVAKNCIFSPIIEKSTLIEK